MSPLTQPNLSEVKRVYLERAGAWPKRAFEEAPKEMETLSLTDLRNDLETLLSLISDAIEKGAHQYVLRRFPRFPGVYYCELPKDWVYSALTLGTRSLLMLYGRPAS